MTPLNVRKLSKSIGRNPGYIYAMKKEGYKFTHGNRTLPEDALQWIADHPDFRSTGYHHSPEALARRKRRQHLQPEAAGNFDEQAPSYG